MAKVKTGIIGCGGIANQKHLPALKHWADRCDIVAFCDIKKERAEKAAKEFGVEGAKVYTDYHELLADPEIVDVHICTPNVSHCEIAVAAFAAGKDVICEKPMAANTEDAQKMMDAWKASGKLFTIGYQNRYRTDAQALKKICEKGELGEVYYARAHAIRRRAVPTWGVFPDKAQQGGGPLIDIGTHALDLTLWYMDNYEPASVMGASFEKLGTLLEPGEQGNAFGDWDNKTYEVEDSAFGFVTMKNGAVISVEASWALNTLDVGEAMCMLSGTKAGADMWPDEGEKQGLRINKITAGRQSVEKPEVKPPVGVAFFDGAELPAPVVEADVWLSAVEAQDASKLVVKPEQAFTVTKILDAIYKSAASGELVKF